jgi:hypothetical protein
MTRLSGAERHAHVNAGARMAPPKESMPLAREIQRGEILPRSIAADENDA